MRFTRVILFLATSILLTSHSFAADDSDCIRMDCLGKCMNIEDAQGKAFPMICIQSSVCYHDADCIKLDDGNCGWVQSEELDRCLADIATTTPGPIPLPVR